MNQNKFSIWLVLFLFVACMPKWDDHYDAGQATVTDQTVWEYLQSRPEYSGFVSLVKETGAEEYLKNSNNLTVWVPVNEKIPDLSGLTDSVKALTVGNHISILPYTTADMKNGIRVDAYSGKRIGIFSDDNVSFRVNDCRIVKADMICRNGIVQEISGWLDLQENLYDYLEKAPQYSMLRELIHQVTDTLFDPENSTLTGETDIMGNPIYEDSAFIVVNKFYNQVPLGRENRIYTLFLTPDWILQEKIEKHYRSIIGYTGENPTKSDTTRLENWLRNSIPYTGSYYDFSGIDLIISVRGIQWKPAYQRLGNRMECSNGTVWQVADLFIPRSLIWPAGSTGDVFSMFEIYKNKPGSVVVNVTGLEPDVMVNQDPVISSSNKDGLSVTVSPIEAENTVPFDLDMTWTIGKTVSSGYYKQITLLPGEYKMIFSFVKKEGMTTDFEIYLNDAYVARLDISDYPTAGNTYSLTKVIKIGEEFAETPTQMSLKTVGGTGKALSLSVLSVTFKQTANNY